VLLSGLVVGHERDEVSLAARIHEDRQAPRAVPLAV